MTAPMSINAMAIQMKAVMTAPPLLQTTVSETQDGRSPPCHPGPLVTHLRGPRWRSRRHSHTNASALRRVVGPDLKITRGTTHLATGRWPDGPHSQGRSALPTRRAEWPNGSDGARRGVAIT
jgi:hypothetical protein